MYKIWNKKLIKKRCVVIGNASINNYDYLLKEINEDDFLIYCDGGLKHLEKLKILPNLIIGDFDSFKNPNLDIETIVLPREKDDTDTMAAVKEGIERGYKDFLLLGVIGERLDHSLANVSILLYLDSLNLKGKIIDDYSEMLLVSKKEELVSDEFSYFSLINILSNAKGVNVIDAKYPLIDATLPTTYQYSVSNEVLPNKVSKISLKEGTLLLIKTR